MQTLRIEKNSGLGKITDPNGTDSIIEQLV